MLEAHAREVVLGWGVKVVSFYDPPHAARDDAPEPVRRWRVRLPDWFPSGSWLDGEHAYGTLDEALTALDETGALDAIDAYWRAKSDESRARQQAFSKIMSAHVRRDQSYDELVRVRHARARQLQEGLGA